MPCFGQDKKGLPPTPDTLRLGCSYHLHSSHRFLSTWGAVTMLDKKKKKKTQTFLFRHSVRDHVYLEAGMAWESIQLDDNA